MTNTVAKLQEQVANLQDQIDMIIKTGERMSVDYRLSQQQRNVLAGFIAGIKDSLKEINDD
jgi:hypothetical protein